MEDLHCPFATTITTSTYQCPMSREVIRRGGSEIACQNTSSHHQCLSVAAQLNEKILPIMGFEYDLLQVPHSMLQKVLLGGLAGLHKFLNGNTDSKIDNINSLVEKAIAKETEHCPVPYQNFAAEVREIKLRKRHK